MNIDKIVCNKKKKGNEILTDLSEIIPEYKDRRIGKKGMYTPNDVVGLLQTYGHYLSFKDILMDGVPNSQ